MRAHFVKDICPFLLLALFSFVLPKAVFAGASNISSRQQDQPTADQVINAVNALRLAYGMVPLNAHPVLMQVAQEEANGIAAGMGGHWRPGNLTLGQWLISLGYPLSGDLTLDGYRSENWVAASTVDEAISFWLGDDPHTNTMLSQNRSDIGAGVAISDQIYIVIETALQTSSGQQQSEAYDILTGVPMTQTVNDTNSAQSAAQSLLPEYIIPVIRSTARPDGDVFHKVQSGQTLWSVAVTYGTTIKSLRALNNLGESTTIYPNQMLLVQKGATQPAPPTSTAGTSTPVTLPVFTPAEHNVSTTTPTATPESLFIASQSSGKYSNLIIFSLILAGVVVAVGFWVNAKK
ncbi:MAG: LysM peptidoglycan-binding domain-containing protein [Anaerolineales bacterium]|nr:LysM peptidoglycan-binding domain-containing protein [Anaerolineales bacterium]